MLLTIDEFQEVIRFYRKEDVDFDGEFPKLPKGAAEFIGWRAPKDDDLWLNVWGTMSTGTSGSITSNRLIVKPMMVYNFITDGIRREPKKGDWVLMFTSLVDAVDSFDDDDFTHLPDNAVVSPDEAAFGEYDDSGTFSADGKCLVFTRVEVPQCS